jgi:hypothetical protein
MANGRSTQFPAAQHQIVQMAATDPQQTHDKQESSGSLAIRKLPLWNFN